MNAIFRLSHARHVVQCARIGIRVEAAGAQRLVHVRDIITAGDRLMFVGELVPARSVELHDAKIRFDSSDVEVGIDPEVKDNDLDITEPRPGRVDLARCVFEAVGGGVIGSARVSAGEHGHDFAKRTVNRSSNSTDGSTVLTNRCDIQV
jgi:hypothetical protein